MYKVPVTDKADVMSVVDGTAVSVRIFNKKSYL